MARFCYTPGSAIKRFGETKMPGDTMSNMEAAQMMIRCGEIYRKKVVTVSAFKWDGNTRDGHNIPAWVKLISRGATLNEATDPPGLIVETVTFGAIKVSHGSWFVHDAETGNVFTRTEEAFLRDYEPNEVMQARR